MPVELTRQDEFAIITLNRPEALNALSFEIVGEIGDAIAEAVSPEALWRDGKETAKGEARTVKENRQADAGAPAVKGALSKIEAVLSTHPVFQAAAQHTAQGSGAVLRFIPQAHEGIDHGVVNLEGESLLPQKPGQISQLQAHNPAQILLIEWSETDHLIDAIQKFRSEMTTQGLIHGRIQRRGVVLRVRLLSLTR